MKISEDEQNILKSCAVKNNLTDEDLKFMEKRIKEEINYISPYSNNNRSHKWRIIDILTNVTKYSDVPYDSVYYGNNWFDVVTRTKVTCVRCKRTSSCYTFFKNDKLIRVQTIKAKGGIPYCVAYKGPRDRRKFVSTSFSSRYQLQFFSHTPMNKIKLFGSKLSMNELGLTENVINLED